MIQCILGLPFTTLYPNVSERTIKSSSVFLPFPITNHFDGEKPNISRVQNYLALGALEVRHFHTQQRVLPSPLKVRLSRYRVLVVHTPQVLLHRHHLTSLSTMLPHQQLPPQLQMNQLLLLFQQPRHRYSSLASHPSLDQAFHSASCPHWSCSTLLSKSPTTHLSFNRDRPSFFV